MRISGLPRPLASGITNHVALLLIKLIGMLLQVPEVGQVFPDMRKEIDPRKGGLLIFVIGAKGNRQPTTFFYAFFQSFEGEPKLLVNALECEQVLPSNMSTCQES